MANITVSIIVPVYNAEKYIRQCLDSVLAQTFTAWEAILVDDGSTDRSGQICDEYATRDSRFRVIHQPNGGVSVARQTGIDNATGEYTIHCDPDDWMESTMLEEMVGIAEATGSDMVICDYYSDTRYERTYGSQNLPLRPKAEDILRMLLLQQLHGSCCNKLVKRACYRGIGFYPSHISIFEDLLHNIRILSQEGGKDLKITYFSHALYHYRIDSATSICRSISLKRVHDEIDVVEELKILLPNIQVEEDSLYNLKKFIIFDALAAKQFAMVKSLFPEVKKQIIRQGILWRMRTPRLSATALALLGLPRVALKMYHIHLWIMRQLHEVKTFVKKN